MATLIREPVEVRWNPEKPVRGIDFLGDNEVSEALLLEIADLKQRLGSETLFLGHSYQRDEVIQFADKSGDSLSLCQYAADTDGIRNIVFLGVHFMAEAADMLTNPDVQVILPDLKAGCTMADMAPIEDIESSWDELGAIVDISSVIPVTYINSSAAVKAHVGRFGGTICTSSNAEKTITWALDKGEKVFFFPDQHLGRNTSYKLGIPLEQMIVWNPDERFGGNTEEEIRDARIILWRGHCSVHQHFTKAQVDYLHNKDENVQVIVHPECSFEVFQNADYCGSTGFIQKTVREAPPNTKWAIGTENNLVARLGREVALAGKEVYSLAPYACLCSTMFRITPRALRDSLAELSQGNFRWRIEVDDDTRELALLALERMFKITRS